MIYICALIGFAVISLVYIGSATIAVQALSIPDQNAAPQSLTITNDKDIDIIPFAGMAIKGPPVPPGPPT
jgi:hypothetical protein